MSNDRLREASTNWKEGRDMAILALIESESEHSDGDDSRYFTTVQEQCSPKTILLPFRAGTVARDGTSVAG